MPGTSTLARGLTLKAHFGSLRHGSALGTLYFALYRGIPGQGGIEPTIGTGGYARVAKTNDDNFCGPITSTQTVLNNSGASGAITFPTITGGGWSILTLLDYWAIHDAATGANVWYWGLLSAPVSAFFAGDTPRIPIGAWQLTLPE
jgi:hypothetical protein